MKLYIVIIGILCLSAGCDKNFEKINTNPVLPSSLDPAYLLAQAELNASWNSGTITYQSAIVRHTMHPFLGVLAGGNVNQKNPAVERMLWDQYYPLVRNLVDIVDKTHDDTARFNLYQMARIWKAYVFQVLTDTYGDIPYAQAGNAFLESQYFPEYDKQQDIYNDLLREVDEAVNALDPSRATEKNELFYNGDIGKWKRFGNSLLLRIAMRLSRVDAAKARTYAAKAFQGGVMTSNADNCLMQHSATYTNAFGNQLNGSEKANYYLNDMLVNNLKSGNDPRLQVIAVIYGDATKDPAQTTQDKDPAHQIGMPTGYDNTTIPTAPGYPGSLYKYSQIDRLTLGNITAPCFHITYAQTSLLLAEAAQKGWITADAAMLYQQGVTAHMQQLAIYGGTAVIPDNTITAYWATHAYNPAAAVEQINTQYWIASLMNGIEAYANWRRTGYPVIPANTYATQDIPRGASIRRLRYPDTEISLNTQHYNDALSRQGADELNIRMWWDVQ
ncbi:SusD/RagB family nutrient-binding outer membrane lipoprotein [Chitinophaga agrisoli]|nr:SusD/RagB family nutrient-binding outer membrane lipoprotein [Chitinophaga agrisoli]